MTAGSHFLVVCTIGPKVNLYYRLLLSSVLLISLLSLLVYCNYLNLPAYPALLSTTNSSAYDRWLIFGWLGTLRYELGSEHWLVGWFVLFSSHCAGETWDAFRTLRAQAFHKSTTMCTYTPGTLEETNISHLYFGAGYLHRLAMMLTHPCALCYTTPLFVHLFMAQHDDNNTDNRLVRGKQHRDWKVVEIRQRWQQQQGVVTKSCS